MSIFRSKNVLVASPGDPSRAPAGTRFECTDLTLIENSPEARRDMDQVFHLAGIKGSPAMTHTRPASFFFPTVAFNTNMMEAARRRKVDRHLSTSTGASRTRCLRRSDADATFRPAST